MATQTLIKDDHRMFELVRADDGQLFQTVVCGGVALHEVCVRLSGAEVLQFNKGGVSFVEELACRIAKAPAAFKNR